MASPFEQIAKESQQKQAQETQKFNAPKKAKFSKEYIKNCLKAGSKTRKSSICALYVGHPKIGKSGVLLESRKQEDIEQGKKIIIFELNNDQGCDLNKKEFHPDDENIIIVDPKEDCWVLNNDGEWILDYEMVMEKLKASIQEIKEDLPNLNLKLIGMDGIDALLEICEKQMRIDENIDAAGDVKYRYWKKRNEYFYDIVDMLLSIDIDKVFITHYAPRGRDRDTGEYTDQRTVSKLDQTMVYGCQKSLSDKMHQVVEFTDESKVKDGKKMIKISATLVADRRSLERYMDKITIAATQPDGKIKWNGQAILEREWK